jgi:predicted trehalose synthase
LLEPWAQVWYHEVVRQLVQSYTETIRPVSLLPSSPEAAEKLLELLVLEKALEEVDAELTGRIDWVVIPLQAVIRLLGHDPNEIVEQA